MFFFFSVMSAAALRVLRCGRVCDAHGCGITLLVAILGERAMALRLVTAQRLPYQSSSPDRPTDSPRRRRRQLIKLRPLSGSREPHTKRASRRPICLEATRPLCTALKELRWCTAQRARVALSPKIGQEHLEISRPSSPPTLTPATCLLHTAEHSQATCAASPSP